MTDSWPSTPRRTSTERAHLRWRHVGRVGLLAFVLVTLIPSVVMTGPGWASAATSTDPRKERQAVRDKKAQVASKLDATKATSVQVSKALDALEQNVSDAQGDYSRARKDALSATASAADAASAAAAEATALAGAKQQLRSLAVRSYVESSTGDEASIDVLVSGAADGLARSGYTEVSAANVGLTVDEIRQRSRDLAILQRRAEQDAGLAAQQKAAEADQLAEVTRRQSEEQALADKLEARLERMLSESQDLASMDANLSAQIAQDDAVLAARLAAVHRSRSGGAPAGVPSTLCEVVAVDATTVVRGIRVDASIATAVGNLIDAASAAGLSLGGSGWRDSNTQIALRRAHCGDSDYGVWSAPASSCHPPTARPGASMHERGKAIDFNCAGSLISSRSDPCYKWLADHAASFGLYNLPSEPWHWSTNGD